MAKNSIRSIDAPFHLRGGIVRFAPHKGVAGDLVLGVRQAGQHYALGSSEWRSLMWLALRYYSSIGLVVVGTLLQLYSKWRV